MVDERNTGEVVGTRIELPGGHLHSDGKVYRDAEIVPMTGRVREAIARKEVRSNPVKVTNIVLVNCIRKVGPVTHITDEFVEGMLAGDRDFLLLEIRKLSMGDFMTAVIDCPSCKIKLDIKFDLKEIETKRLEDKQWKLVGNERAFRLRNDVLKVDALFRFPRGRDQAGMFPLLDQNPVRANYSLYAQCLLEFNGQQGPFGIDLFESMDLKQLDFLEESFFDTVPGPDMRQHVSCPTCSSEIALSFEGSDFLFRRPKPSRK